MKNKDGKRLYSLGRILAVFVVLSIISAVISLQILMFTGTFTAIMACIWLVTAWDDIIVWWSTLGTRKKSRQTK